jgi:hypothetical protein
MPEEPTPVTPVIQELFDWEESDLGQRRIYQGRGVSLANNHAVPVGPVRLLRVETEDVSIKDRNQISGREA